MSVCFVLWRVDWGLTKDCDALSIRQPHPHQADWFLFKGEYDLASVRIKRIISLSQFVIHIA